MAAFLPLRINPKSLAEQITDAELQVSNRQRGVGACSTSLFRQIHQKMTAPASLLLAGGLGFIIGELTKRPKGKEQNTTDNTRTFAATPLNTMLNFITLVRTYYTALLPLAWMLKSFHQPCSPEPTPEHSCRPEADASDSGSPEH